MHIKFNIRKSKVQKRTLILKKSKKITLNKTFKKSSSSKNISATKLALVALAILIGLMGLSKLFSFVSNFWKPFNSGLSSKQYSWDGKSAVNIVFKTSDVWVLHFDPKEKKAIALKVPEDTYVDLPGGYGSWRVGSIYNLGQEETPPVGASLLKETLSLFLGLPVDGFVITNDEFKKDLPELISNWHNNPISVISFLIKSRTDFNALEAFRFFKELVYLRNDKLIALDLFETNITKSKLLPDASRALGVNYINLDLFIRDKMADEEISHEGIEVAIYNATTHAGLAQEASRVVTNLGAEVIVVSNSETFSEVSKVISDDKSTQTFIRLAQVFAPWCLKSDCSFADERINLSRGEVIVVIGEDFFKRRYKN